MAVKEWLGNAPSHVGDWSYAANWNPSGVPADGDDVILPPGAEDVTDGLDQSAIALASLDVRQGYDGTIGTATEWFQIETDKLTFRGSGAAYLDLGASACAPQIYATATATTGERGLYLIGSALTTVVVMGGSVGLAIRAGETATAATVRVTGSGASCWIGAGVTLTTAVIHSGELMLSAHATTLTVHGGRATSADEAAITTANVWGGVFVGNSSGTVTTLAHRGGVVDMSQSSVGRTITTYTPTPAPDPGLLLLYDSTVVTITTWTQPTIPTSITLLRI